MYLFFTVITFVNNFQNHLDVTHNRSHIWHRKEMKNRNEKVEYFTQNCQKYTKKSFISNKQDRDSIKGHGSVQYNQF